MAKAKSTGDARKVLFGVNLLGEFQFGVQSYWKIKLKN